MQTGSWFDPRGVQLKGGRRSKGAKSGPRDYAERQNAPPEPAERKTNETRELHVPKAQFSFDVVVLDERMPKLNGTEVVRTLSPVPPPPVIMMASAYDFDSEFRQSLGQRVFKYLKKPVAPKVLIEAVTAACAGIPPS